MHRHIALIAVFAGLAFSASAQAATHLVGTVGPGFDITLKTASGKQAGVLAHGTYIVVVHDRSNIHDFHLKGPGVNRTITSVSFVGTKTVHVTLKKGRYTYMCDPHSFAMHGAFRVR